MGPPKSAEGVRVVHLAKQLAGDVTKHLDEHAGLSSDALLLEPVGEAEFLDDLAFNGPWNRAREAAGVRRKITEADGRVRYGNEVTEHDLRAYAGTIYAQNGATLRETMAFLGHVTAAAAISYQRTIDRAAELADRMIAPLETSLSPSSLG